MPLRLTCQKFFSRLELPGQQFFWLAQRDQLGTGFLGGLQDHGDEKQIAPAVSDCQR